MSEFHKLYSLAILREPELPKMMAEAGELMGTFLRNMHYAKEKLDKG